jgi:hypothetical protein
MTTFGDVSWARSTNGGRLGAIDRLRQTFAAVRFRLRSKLAGQPRVVGASSPEEIDRMIREVELPETTLVSRAAALVEELGPPVLANHALRTFAWGGLLGVRDGLAWDRETFALGALFHDLALARRTSNVPCFAVDSACQAADLLAEWDAPSAQQAKVADAISMHLRISVPPSVGVEAYLVNAGAAVDVVGARLAEVPPASRAHVLGLYPRDGIEDYLLEALGREAKANPRSRIGLWVSLGFLDRVSVARHRFGGRR